MNVPTPDITTERKDSPAAAVRTIAQPRFHSSAAVTLMLTINPLLTARLLPVPCKPSCRRITAHHVDATAADPGFFETGISTIV
jgi:hypothetical protein